MAKLTYAILCRSAAVDQFTQSLSIFDVVEGVTIETPDQSILPAKRGEVITQVPGFPMILVTSWRRSDIDIPETINCRVGILSASGQQLGSAPLQVDLSAVISGRVLMKIPLFPVSGEGTYTLRTEMETQAGWDNIHEYPFSLTINVQDLAQQGAS